MNPVLLGSTAALCWGTLDFLAANTSRRIGYVRTTAGVTITGLVLLTAWLGVAGSFPSLLVPDVWMPAFAGVGFALATLWLFAAISSGPVSLAVPIVMSYPATTVVLAAAIGRPPSAGQLALVAFVMAGVLIAAWAEADNTEAASTPGRRRRTIGFAALSHVTFLFAVLAGQKASLIFGEIESVWISRLAGVLAVVPMLFWRNSSPPTGAALWGVMGLMGGLDVLALSLVFAAGHSPQPELAIVCASAAGAVTVILAWLINKERVLPLRWLGIAMTFAGIGALSAVK